MTTARVKLGETPLTDPKSVVVSLLVNGGLLLAASLMALGVVLPGETTPVPRVLNGELDPTDNRAPFESGGGAPGESGGRGVELSSDRRDPVAPTRDPAADALLSEILPTRASSDLSPRALPGPSTSGLGLIAGPGAGGGGGEGAGSRGAIGGGVGPGTAFFGLRDRGNSYAYVIDCSGSMDTRAGQIRGPNGSNSLDVAKRELLASLDPLPADAKFAVVFYNMNATVFTDPAGRKDLMSASPSNKARLRTHLAEVNPFGSTDHITALKAAFAMRPEVIFFLTDADLMTKSDADEVRREAGRTRIFAVELGIGPAVRGSVPLRRLAESTGGSYRYIDVGTIDTRPR